MQGFPDEPVSYFAKLLDMSAYRTPASFPAVAAPALWVSLLTLILPSYILLFVRLTSAPASRLPHAAAQTWSTHPAP